MRLTIDGELLAYCAMKAALEDIVAARDAKPWDCDADKMADIARDVLEVEARMTDGA